MNKKILLILLSLAVTICVSLVFAACGQSTRYSELEMEDGIVYLTDYSIKYTSDEESPLGNVNESSLSEEKSGSVQTYYLVMDFDIQTAEDIPGMEWLTVTMKVLDADVVKATINYTNTSSTTEITADGETTITATYSLPEKAKELKNVSLVVELRAQSVGATDIVFSFESDNKTIIGYEDFDTTYIYSSNTITLNKTSFEYTFNDEGQSYTVTGLGTKSNLGLKAFYMSDTYNSLPITAIADSAFENCTSMTKITLPESITQIGKSAFKSCTSLNSVTIGENVTTIGESAFADCTSLSSATIGEKVKTIGASAFSNCRALTEIVIPDGVSVINDNTFYNCSSLASATIPDSVSIIGASAFYNCTSLAKIEIPDSVTSIGNSAFNLCSSMTSATIGENVATIGESAFADCTSLSSITIGESVKTIGSSAFSNCSALTEIIFNATAMEDLASDSSVFADARQSGHGITVTIGANVTKIPAYLFYDSSKLISVVFKENNKCESIGDDAFYNCTSLSSVAIGKNVTTIGDSAFASCSALTEIIIPDSVTSIGDYTFYGCSSLTSIMIPDRVTTIGSSAFESCTSLTSITIGDSVKAIGDRSFYDCTALTEINFNASAMSNLSSSSNVFYKAGQGGNGITVTIGANVTNIPAYLFYPHSGSNYAPKIASVVFEDNSKCETIGDYAFWYCTSLENVYYSGTASQWASISFGNIISNPLYYAGNLYLDGTLVTDITIKNITAINAYAFYNCTSLTSVTIGDGVTSIGDDAFCKCSKLTSIAIPDSVRTIGTSAFSNCTSLTSITIPDSVTTIGSYAFYNCTSLTSITIPDSVTSIGSYAFSDCTSLTSVYYTGTASQWARISFGNSTANPLYYAGKLYLDGTLATDITIKNITAINEYAFYNCTSLTSVTIPDSVTSIGKYAFYNCTALAKIEIPDSVTSIGDGAFYNCAALTEINFDASAMGNLSSSNNVFYKAGQDGTGITVTIGANVTNIPAYLFYPHSDSNYAPKIASVVFEDNSVCTSIGTSAFSNCTSLTSITIPDSVTSIGSYAFSDCTSLTSVYYTGTASQWARISFGNIYANPLYYAGNLYLDGTLATDITIKNITAINAYAFYNCSSLTSITIPDEVTTIGKYAFYNCTSLTNLTIGKGVATIGDYTFYNCTSLTGVYITDITSWCSISYSNDGFGGGVSNPLYYAGNLYLDGSLVRELVIPDTITTIGDYAFEYCTSLRSVIIGNSVTTIGNQAFYYCISLTSVTIGSSVTTIGKYAFSCCNKLFDVCNLSSLTITAESSDNGYVAYYAKNVYTTSGKSSLVTQGEYVFYNMDDSWYLLNYIGTDTELTLPDLTINGEKVSYGIYEYAFYHDTAIKSVIIPDSVTSIGDYAFYGCTSLMSITIGSSVTTMGKYAFYDCTSMTEINFNATALEDLSSWYDVFYRAGQNSDGITVTIGANVTKIPAYLFALGTYVVGSDLSPKITSVVFEENSKCETIGECAFYKCTSLESITIPENVTSIGEYAFYDCTAMTEINFNATAIDSFYSNAFNSIGTSGDGIIVTIGANVTKIPANLFYGRKIKSVVFEDNSACASIGDYAFYNCTSLTSIAIPDSVTTIGRSAFYNCSSLISVTIGSGVTAIGNDAFHNCSSLTSVTIGSGVTTIGNYAFSNCTSLTGVYITDIASWCNITFSDVSSNPLYYAGNLYLNGSIVTDVVIPDGVTAIGDYTFYNCSNLTGIIIPESVTTIAGGAFYGCSSLVSITLPFVGSGTDALTASESTLFGYIFGTTRYTGGTATTQYYASSKYVTYYIPATLTTVTITGGNILYGAFYNCSSLASITIRDGVTAIGDYAFYNCTSLTSIAIPDGVTTIGNYAFYYCTSLTSVTIPDGVTTIGNYAFSNCTSLESVYITDIASWCKITFSNVDSNPLYYAGNLYLNGSVVTDVVIPDGVTSIDYTFRNCTSLTSIIIPESVTTIGRGAFTGCSSLESITLPFVGSSADATTASTSTLFGYIFGTTSYTGGTATTQYYAGGKDVTYYIPATLTTVTITGGNILYGTFCNCSTLTSINIPDNLLIIDNYMFYNCSSLENITIPDGVTTIGDYAFYNCNSLTSITIPDGVTTIGYDAFSYCTALTEINFNATTMEDLSYSNNYVFDYAGQNADGIIVTIGANVTKIPAYLFDSSSYALKITSVVFEKNSKCVSIGNCAFRGCSSLTNITIPDSVTTIGTYAFYYCTSLTSITIPDGVTTIGKYAFYKCTALTEINFNATVMSDLSSDNYVFADAGTSADGIKVSIGANVTKIPASLFNPDYEYSPKITSVVFEENSKCESIGNSAFSGCTSLTSITLPDSVISIGSYAFYYCTALTEINFNEKNSKCTSIGERAFYDCTSLINITLPDSITTIGIWVFGYCTSLTSITMGNSLTIISDSAFYYCTSLTGITIPDSVTTIGDSAFYWCGSLKSVYYTGTASQWAGISFSSYLANPLYNIGNLYLSGSLATDIILDGIVSINSYAFYGCNSLMSITIGDNVTSISNHAFSSCYSLTSVTIGNNVTTIGTSAFYYCSSLTSVTIGDSVTTIGTSAFYHTSLESVTIPDDVTTIGSSAFEHCYSLKSVYYKGTASEWSNIGGISNSYITSYGATVYYYAESGSTTAAGNYWYYDNDGNIKTWSVE